MNTFAVQRAWLTKEGYRLGPTVYAEGALAIRDRITQGGFQWRELAAVAEVFRGPLHTRIYVRDPTRGVPYVTAADVPLADWPRDTHLSVVRTPELPVLRVKSGWTLIS